MDTVGRSQLLRIVTWSSLGGVVTGLMGIFGVVQGGWGIPTVVRLFFTGWAISFAVPFVVWFLSGRAAGRFFAPSGRSTPRRQGHSFAESLAARGLYDEAVAAYEAAIVADPTDPRPYLDLARLHRDRTRRLDEAAHWFKRTLAGPRMSGEAADLVRRELLELYVVGMGAPEKAAPFLARTAAELTGTPAGVWAAERLAEIRTGIAERDPEA